MATLATVVALVLGIIGTTGTLASTLWGRQRDRTAGALDERRLSLDEYVALTGDQRGRIDDLETQIDRERADCRERVARAETREVLMREQRDTLWVALQKRDQK